MFAEIDHPGLGLLMDPTNYFEDHNIDKMDAVLKQIFDTLSDKIRISHAKDVKRAETDTSEKHADIGDEDALESHTFRGVGEIELPAPGLGSLNYDLHFARQRPDAEGGRMIFLMTDRYVGAWEAMNRPRTIDYPFTLIQLQLDRNGRGVGKASIATQITQDPDGTIVLENFSSQPVMLT